MDGWMGWTALMVATAGGHGAFARLLMAAGAAVNARADNGWTAAMWAARYGRVDCLGVLIAAGADLEAKDEDGCTAGMRAEKRGRGVGAALIEAVVRSRREEEQMDLAAGAAVSQPLSSRARPRV